MTLIYICQQCGELFYLYEEEMCRKDKYGVLHPYQCSCFSPQESFDAAPGAVRCVVEEKLDLTREEDVWQLYQYLRSRCLEHREARLAIKHVFLHMMFKATSLTASVVDRRDENLG